ncbi:putative mediator of RNA polymerase II transcription subunit 26 [Drosophila miranda]|uniref:putative mediator of RNA polymerase II transcription subunit 26 n=1 Tax=Drosophila miranda TaxID=7229 RepID=UPI0007E7BBAD|nr:putative mediator of RNA polymerase II transcription subunit 26 [Drosophila miranda]
MMISKRHKSNDLVTILCLGCSLLLLLSAAPVVHSAGGVFEVLAQSTASETEATATTTTTKTNASQDEVGQPQPQPQPLTPGATTAPRLDHNNNNEWRPLGHGDPLQKDPTYDYSPPALDRVRYWAENNGTGQSNPEARKKELPPEVLRNKTKSEILLLGVASERVRVPHSHSYPGMGLGQQLQQQQQKQQQQAKYAAIRRSYYAPPQQQQFQQQIQQQNQQFQQQYTQKHQQHLQNPQQSHSQSQQHSQIQQQLLQNQHQHQPQFQQQPQQHIPPTHLMPPPMMMMKAGSGSGSGSAPSHTEYRHSMMGGSPISISGSPSMSTSYMSHISHMSSPPPKQSMTSSMAYHPPYTSWHTSAPFSGMSSMPPHRLNYADAHHQESMQHYSFSSSPHQTVSYSPNSLTGHLGGSKASLRKPWLHELLQKEVVLKPKVKPTMPATKYLMGTSKPYQSLPPAGYGISSTRPPMAYATVTFVPQTSSSSGFRPMLSTSPTNSTSISMPMTTPTSVPIYLRPEPTSSTTTTTTTTTTTNNRLLIPQTSNLAQRPTVAPAPESTTDSLFSHYRQPPKALLGPMYLIIEGHSKVKTYGQNELDPHSPKIVPVISKREPVVRIADPNEKRGTVETFQVKHLHTKTTPMTTTTERPSTTTTRRTVTSSTTKPTQRATTLKTTATTSLPPSTTPSIPRPLIIPSTPPPSGVNDLLSLLDNMFADVHEIASSTTSHPASVPNPIPASSTMSTILKPVSTRLLPQQPEPRIGSQAGSISSVLEDDEAGEDLGSEVATSTELSVRATRQVFDYDQLPESRVKVGATVTTDIEYNDDDNDDEEEDELEEAGFDDEAATSASQQEANEEAEEEEEEDNEHNLLKRIDRFVDDVDDGEDDLEDLIEGLSPDEDDGEADDAEGEERRQQH